MVDMSSTGEVIVENGKKMSLQLQVEQQAKIMDRLLLKPLKDHFETMTEIVCLLSHNYY